MDVGWCYCCWLWNVVDLDLKGWAHCHLVVGKVANHVEAMKSRMGCRMRDPNLEFGVDPVKEEDWACGLRDWHRRNWGALMVRRLRVLQWVPKSEVTGAIVGRELWSRIVELDFRIVYYIPDRICWDFWHHWRLIAFSIMQLVNET